MLLFDNLPEDIHLLVIKRLHTASVNIQYALKKNIFLLSVCQRWRWLAIPLVFADAYIDYTSGYHHYSYVANSRVVSCVKTNLDLIVAANCIDTVKLVAIEVYCSQSPFEDYRRIVKILQRSRREYSATHLSISIRNSPQSNGTGFNSEVTDISQSLYKLLPRVTSLKFEGTGNDAFARILYGRIAESFSGQLTILDSNHPISVSDSCVFKNLQCATIDVDNYHQYKLPQMHTTSLKTLKLFNCASDHSWLSFKPRNSDGDIEFPSLEVLHLAYGMHIKGNTANLDKSKISSNRNPKLLVPSLNSLYLTCDADKCAVLENLVLPNHMDTICIQATAAVYKQVSKIALPSSKSLSLFTDHDSGNVHDTVTQMNKLLSSATNSDVLAMVIGNGNIPISAADISCTSLTNLDISAPVNSRTLLALINKLNRLKQLSISQLTADGIESNVALPSVQDQKNKLLAPFNTKLDSIMLGFQRNTYSYTVFMPLFVLLLLRLPMLRLVALTNTPENALFDQLEQYTVLYPHLFEISYDLSAYHGSSNTSEFSFDD